MTKSPEPTPTPTFLTWASSGWRRAIVAKRCRQYVTPRAVCGEPATWELNRGHSGPRWWGYCDRHLYGRVELDGELWFVHDPDSGWSEEVPND